MYRHALRFSICLVVLSLYVVPAFGGSATPPQIRDCDGEFAVNEYNNRIDCKTENANVALFDYVDTVIEFEKMRREFGRVPLFTDAQMDHLTSARERAQNAKNRSHAAKSFRGQVKKQKAEDEDCYVKERLGDMADPHGGDDVQPCEKNEICEELAGDQVGNDDGICDVAGNPKDREVCVLVCQQTLLDDDETYDGDSAFDTEQGLEELEVVIGDATNEVKKAMARMQAYYSTRPSGPVDECETFEFDLFPPSYALQASQVAKNVADAVFNSCSVACNQDAFGWNCEAACVVFAVISGVLNGVDDAFSVIDGANGSEQLDRVAKCNRQLNQKLIALALAGEATDAAIEALALQVEAMTKLVETRFLDVEDHLCTPQGQRECFPDGVERTTTQPVRDASQRPGGKTGSR
jgi:hypothetical protein